MTTYPAWSIVYYCGSLWRVCGPSPDGRVNLRRCGHEFGVGTWGSDGYGRPVMVAATVKPKDGMLTHA
jgi:hypothetical protein